MSVNKLNTHDWSKEEIKDSIGVRVWVCQYTTKPGASQPIRNVEPALYEIYDNNELPKGSKVIYYSDVHLRRVLNNGSTSKTVTPIYDNTGWKSNPGNPVLFSQQEAPIRDKYSELLEKAINVHKLEIESIQEQIDQLRNKQVECGNKAD